ncbi:AraC family transcriptional regulator [Flavobacterium sp. '19STA2R22 D10 B1']|uniref:AraC family transcriptional regulator n=1 Tax=Flavobacterium aerium TaxID=3037261 RepID=UPI00278C16CE|nr:AraC family transcriptional regulator [Flavobacterium sp. '19STA2R22 D10 B1']
MERFIQHEALFIRHFTTMQWPFPLHNHNHFELMFLHYGSGIHELNDDRQPYKGPCLFLLAPSDYHVFEIEEETKFSVLKFSNTYLGGASSSAKDEWNKLIDYLIAVSVMRDSFLVKSSEEMSKIEQLMFLITREWQSAPNPSNEVVLYLIRAVFALIKKNAIHVPLLSPTSHGDLFIAIMDEIHITIHNPALHRLEVLASKFNLSPNHLSSIFKQNMGVPIKKYIGDYKFKLIENRLKFSKALIKEISNEFEFNDLSHFNKFVKNNSGLNPKEIRRTAIKS